MLAVVGALELGILVGLRIAIPLALVAGCRIDAIVQRPFRGNPKVSVKDALISRARRVVCTLVIADLLLLLLAGSLFAIW